MNALPSPRTWVDGVEQHVTDADWAQRQLTCLGCAYRVVIPADSDNSPAWQWARDRALQVAGRFGATFDEVPWLTPGDPGHAWEVHCVWEHRFRAPLGAATTRVRPLAPPVVLERTARAVPLPFPYGSRSVLAGLSVPHPALEAAAARHLSDVEVEVGLWVDHDGEVCTSTAGPLLVRTPDGWTHPRPESGAVPTWTWQQYVIERGSRPARLAASDLTGPDCTTYAISDTGVVTALVL